MPIFDYRCQQCLTQYDVLHLGRERTEDIQCPQCGSPHHRKLISLPVIVMKSGVSTKSCQQKSCEMRESCCGEVCGGDN